MDRCPASLLIRAVFDPLKLSAVTEFPPQAPYGNVRGFFHVPSKHKRSPMFIPFMAAAAVAATFTNIGAMTVKVALLGAMVNALLLITVCLAAYIFWLHRTT